MAELLSPLLPGTATSRPRSAHRADPDEHASRAFVRTTRSDHTPAHERLSRVKVPVLVVMGTKDVDWPDPTAEARFVAESLNGELLLVPDAGHYPMTEYPELVNPALVAFARRALPGA